MIRRLLIFITILAVTAALGGYFLSVERAQSQKQHATAKAPEQQLTIIEGWTTAQIDQYLAGKQLIQAGDFIAAEKKYDTKNFPLLASRPAGADLQGFLFPDTYRVYKNTASGTELSEQLISKMLNNFSAKFTPDMQAQAAAQKMSVYQILTLASIIEKETGRNAVSAAQKQALDQERKTIAGIFYNRLNAGMPLESDATVNYATGKNDPQPTLADTQINSPYNTYLRKGLPPGPICSPSLSSILAALYPTKTDYLYFLHDQTTGQAIFAVTYDQHLQNKQKYLH
ncbi:MAG: endolytic transglycosylase MltG [Patescibacteria group bacterium]|nr:endolytic transglycosylase MltG [Patescibacteria group bacterium]